MAITTPDGLTAALAAAQWKPIQKASLANQTAGFLSSLWRATGNQLQGAIPGAAETCTSALTGGIPYTNPTATALSYLVNLNANMAAPGSILIYDRLAHMGGLAGNVASPTAQTVNLSIPASRNAAAAGSDVEWFLEWYTNTGSTAVTATITYTNQADGTGNTTTCALTATMRAGRLLQIIPGSGGLIKSIQTVTLSATTGTAGSFGVTVAKRLGLASTANAAFAAVADAINLGLPVIPDNACLWPVVACSTTATGIVAGMLAIGQG
jgi:hypothetical protein